AAPVIVGSFHRFRRLLTPIPARVPAGWVRSFDFEWSSRRQRRRAGFVPSILTRVSPVRPPWSTLSGRLRWLAIKQHSLGLGFVSSISRSVSALRASRGLGSFHRFGLWLSLARVASVVPGRL